MDSNRDDAERCLQLAENALKANDFPKARRLLEKSKRMYPLPELQAALSAKIATAATRSSASPAQPANESPQPKKEIEPEPVKEPTADMISAVKAVHDARNKSHYSVLGVAKDADESAIKKSYRRLALKLHPDRNCAPGSDEAFKRVSQAFVTLSDAERRTHYDTFGTDDPAQPPPRTHRRRRRGRNNNNADFDQFFTMQHQMTTDELFEFLFNATAANPQFRHAEPVPNDGESFWERFKPIILMFVVLFFAMILSKDADSAPFSLHRTGYHNMQRSTENGVTYFVSSNLDLSSHRSRQRLNSAVDRTAFDEFSKKCAREREHAAYLLAESRRWLNRASVRQQFRRKYDSLQQPWCARATRLYNHLQQHHYRL